MKKLARILWILFLLPLTIQAQEEEKNTLVQKDRKFKLFNNPLPVIFAILLAW